LDNQVAIRIAGPTLVDRVVVATTADLVPTTIDAIAIVIAVHVVRASENDVTNTVARASVVAVAIAAVVRDSTAADDRHVAVGLAPRALNHGVTVAVGDTALVDRVSVGVATDYLPRTIGTANIAVGLNAAADDGHVAIGITTRALHDDVAVRVTDATLVDRVAAAVATDYRPGTVHRGGTACWRRQASARNLSIERCS